MLPRRGMIQAPEEPPVFQPGKYRHYKGGEYRAVCLACDEETHEWMVVYRPIFDHDGAPDVWVRPYKVFSGKVMVDGINVPRFSYIPEAVVDTN